MYRYATTTTWRREIERSGAGDHPLGKCDPAGKNRCRRRPDAASQKILFESNGIADEDLAVGRYVWEQARRKKIGVRKVSEI
jgi:hypothetical protein